MYHSKRLQPLPQPQQPSAELTVLQDIADLLQVPSSENVNVSPVGEIQPRNMDWEVGSSSSGCCGSSSNAEHNFEFMEDVSDMLDTLNSKHDFDWMENIIKL